MKMKKQLKIVNPHKLIGRQIDQVWTVDGLHETNDEWVFRIHNPIARRNYNIFLEKFSRPDGRWWFSRRGASKSLVGYDIDFFSSPDSMIFRLANEMRSQKIIKT